MLLKLNCRAQRKRNDKRFTIIIFIFHDFKMHIIKLDYVRKKNKILECFSAQIMKKKL